MKWAAVVLSAMLALPALAQRVDLPVSAQDRQSFPALGWSRARDQIGLALIRTYRPGGLGGTPGITGYSSYASWMGLWQWCELLSRREDDEIVRFLSQHIFVGQGGKYIRIGPGYTREPGMTPLSAGQLQSLMKDREEVTGIMWKFAPGDYKRGNGTLADRIRPDFLATLVGDDDFSRMFFGSLSQGDFTPMVLSRLQEIHDAHPDRWADYKSLALALALVDDELPPDYWPHYQVEQKLVPFSSSTVPDRFVYWVGLNESHQTLDDLRTLEPGELKFVVDALVSDSELDWARKNVRLNRQDFAKAFSMVKYDMDRYRNDQYVWRNEPYTLANILKNGGICVDQAYFAMICGKAFGLPTLFFTGQGVDGGHAWFGYRKDKGKWELDCGRYENQNYATGHALDPQTWEPITDHDLEFLAQGFHDKPEYADSQRDLIMAGMIEKAGYAALADRAYESALEVCPENADAWDARADFLRRTKASLLVQRDLEQRAIQQFATNNDIRVAHQEALANISTQLGDTQSALGIQRQIVSQNRDTRTDLSVNSAAQHLSELIDSNDVEGAMADYRSQIRRLSAKGGGDFFIQIVEPFVTALLKASQPKVALKAVDLAVDQLSPEPGSILDQELSTLKQTVLKQESQSDSNP